MDAGSEQAGNLCRCRGCGFIFPAKSEHNDCAIDRDCELIPTERYRMIAPLSSRGSGRVYLARHLVLDEPCVIKVLSTIDPGYSESACRRFMDEAKAGFRIQHPNVARVLDCDHVGDEWYFVMEYVDGVNLDDITRSCRRLPWPQVARIGVQTANGLTAIHDANLLHRDIKPSNLILCPDGSVRIADLGLVEILHGAHRETSVAGGFGFGTPPYMPPEQRDGSAELDERADIHALGATLYHLLTGQPPGRGRGPLGYLTGGDEHAPLRWGPNIVPPIPIWLRQVIEKCVSPQREQRFASAAALGAELADWLARSEPPIERREVPGIGTPRGVVVLPFDNLSSNSSDDWLASALAEEVHNTLLATAGVQTVDRHEMLQLLGRLLAENGESPTDHMLLATAGHVGAAVVVRGGYQVSGDKVAITASALDDKHPSGRILTRVTGAFSEIIELQAKVGAEVASALDRRSSTHRPSLPKRRHRSGRTARRAYVAGQSAFAAGHYAEAVGHCRKGLANDPDSTALLSLMGVCHSRLGAYDEAIQCHQRMEAIARQSDDPYRLVEATGNLAVMYYFKDEFAPAYELLRQAGELAAELNLLPLLAKNHNNLGFVLTRMERLGEADRAFEAAIGIKSSLGATASLVSPYNGRGEIALCQGRFQDALRLYGQALQLSEELSDPVNIGICHTNLGRCRLHLQDLDEAEKHLREALEGLGSTEFWSGTTTAFEQLAELHLMRKRPEAAFECIDKRIDLAQRHANRRVEAAAWEQKSRAYELAAQTDAAMLCLRKSFQLQQNKSPSENLSAARLPANRRSLMASTS